MAGAIAIICVIMVAMIIFLQTPKDIGPCTEYQCDVKIISLSTAIEIDKEGKNFAEVNGNLTAEMVGQVNFLGNTYDIYNATVQKIARITFNALSTNGEMYDMQENLIADYNSKLFMQDFTVRTTEKCTLDEKTILMIFCSYHSDQIADSSN